MEDLVISTVAKSDPFILKTIGVYVKKNRMDQEITQLELADHAGVARSTVVQLEGGRSITLLSLIQILRALKKLDILNAFDVKTSVSPLQMAVMEQQARYRVRKPKQGNEPKLKSDW